jgi:hypothetical protein
MAGAPVPGYRAFWAERRASLKSEYQVLIKQYPDADTQYRLLYKTISTIEDAAGCMPAAVGESTEWTAIGKAAEENRASNCEAPSGKVFFSVLYGTCTVVNELKSLLKTSNSPGGTDKTNESVKTSRDDGFKEVRRRKRHSNNEAAPNSKYPRRKPTAPPKKRTPRATSSLPSGQRLWTPILRVQRPLHWRRQSLVKQVGRPQ